MESVFEGDVFPVYDILSIPFVYAMYSRLCLSLAECVLIFYVIETGRVWL